MYKSGSPWTCGSCQALRPHLFLAEMWGGEAQPEHRNQRENTFEQLPPHLPAVCRGRSCGPSPPLRCATWEAYLQTEEDAELALKGLC